MTGTAAAHPECEASGVSDGTTTTLRDPIHGCITLGSLCSQALHTQPLQRLRHLKQLGSCSFAFPAAEHSRFAHSLGVAHLARCAVLHLAAGGGQEVDVRPIDVELASLAGLAHDLGHGPFSHSFESFLGAALGHGHAWRHEDMSCQLLELVVQQAGLDLDTQQMRRVHDMIDSRRHSSSSSNSLRQPLGADQAWRLQVVSNDLNGVDVDKLDYLARDATMTGVPLAHDARSFLPLLTQHCKVMGGNICFDARQQRQLAGLFQARADLHAAVYQQPAAKAAELMLVDALLLAEPLLDIRSKLFDPDEFVTLDDSIIQQVAAAARADGGSSAHLARAAAVIARLQRQDLYAFVAEAELPVQQQEQGLTVADVVGSQQPGGNGVRLVADDVRLHHFCIDHGRGAADPLASVLLYDAAAGPGSGTWATSQGIDRPPSFSCHRVRAYLATQCCDAGQEAAYAGALRAAFERALQGRYRQQGGARLVGNSGGALPLAAAAHRRAAASALLQQRPGGPRCPGALQLPSFADDGVGAGLGSSQSSSSASVVAAWSPEQQRPQARQRRL